MHSCRIGVQLTYIILRETRVISKSCRLFAKLANPRYGIVHLVANIVADDSP